MEHDVIAVIALPARRIEQLSKAEFGTGIGYLDDQPQIRRLADHGRGGSSGTRTDDSRTGWHRVDQSVMLREKVARLIGQPIEKMGDTQWIGHILKRLHLLDEAGRKRGMDGITYAVKSSDVIDMMRRYDVAIVYKSP